MQLCATGKNLVQLRANVSFSVQLYLGKTGSYGTLCSLRGRIVVSSPAPSAISVPPGHLAPRLDHGTLQLWQRDAHRRAFWPRGANRPWPPFGEGDLGRVRLGGAQVGVAGSGVGAVLGGLPALRCGRGGPWRLARGSALGPRRAGPARRRRTGGSGVIGLSAVAARCGWSGGASRGPTCGRSGMGSSLGSRGVPPWPAPVRGPAVQGRWGPLGAAERAAQVEPRPLPAAAPPALLRFPPCTLGSMGSGSGTGIRGGCPAWGSDQSLTLQLLCQACVAAGVPVLLSPSAPVACRGGAVCCRGGHRGGSPGWSWASGHPPALR